MTRELLHIAGGQLYDPLHNIDGEVRDVWIEAGRVVAPPSDLANATVRQLDATGLIVMPGGVDMHCHIAGPKVNAGRKLLPEHHRRAECLSARVFHEKEGTRTGGKEFRPTNGFRKGTVGSVPSTFTTGYLYAGLGYTTAMDAAIAPLMARHAHQQFADTPCIDRGMFVLTGNNHFILDALADGDARRLRDYLGWLLTATRGYAPKVVNPGGVENWKGRAGNATDLDAPLDAWAVTPRQIIAGIAQAAAELALPHPLHLHTLNLGLPGNWQTTLATMQALDGHRGHLAHIQFHSYAGGDVDETTFGSAAAPLVDYVNAHDNLTVDVGQVMFGRTASMTGDGPLGHYLANLYGAKWYSCDIELEAGCGVSPLEYKHKSLVHAWQWAIGLEWFLTVADPWKVAMSTDHPNGAAFLAYPQIINLLMSRDARRAALERVHPKVREQSPLRDITREYSLREIAIITRAGPARMLGLANKGHLGVGADADVTIYTPSADREQMFTLPRFVIKGGETLVEQGELRRERYGRTLHVTREVEPSAAAEIAAWYERYSTVRPCNFGISADYLGEPPV